ncbi:hypothetical protein [Lentzea sp. HUAS12]|uniref:hypothetical protein n=1 Tax=Lentzea sp. HUAS12 TaxID=2951806 RepID=UPI00209D3E71|nr:hypothetical protein [Lentzea sp. HUAS12]USX48592.1 hypothetical protein ND450_24265 [Lentzea sp. HUAS12]
MCADHLGEHVHHDIEDHPDLKDAAWIRAANRRAKRDVRKMRRRARLRRHSGKVVSLIALVVIGGVLYGMHRAGEFRDVSLPDVTLPTEVAPYRGVNTEVPFAGTPAEQWADGEKGIVAPDQNPEYAAGYEAARKALVAGHLDPKVIADHDLEPLLGMMSPETRDMLATSSGSISLTRLKKGSTLLPNGIKVDGRMWPGRDEHGRPVVHTSYRFAYAFDPGDQKSLLDQYEIVALQRADVDYQLVDGRIWLPKVDGFVYSMGCQAAKEGFLAPMFSEKRFRPTTTQSPEDDRKPEEWFDPNAPMPTSGCD